MKGPAGRAAAIPLRLAATGLLAALLLGACFGPQIGMGGAAAGLQKFHAFFASPGDGGPAAFALLQVAGLLSGIVPASLLALAAGALYGPVAGFLMAAGGALAGAAIAFGLGRSMFRPAIERLARRSSGAHAVDRAVAQGGWKCVGLLRLSPVPFALASYLLGLSSISFPEYIAGTLACLPALFAYALLGSAGTAGFAAVTGGEGGLHFALLGVGGLATAVIGGQSVRLFLRLHPAAGRPPGAGPRAE